MSSKRHTSQGGEGHYTDHHQARIDSAIVSAPSEENLRVPQSSITNQEDAMISCEPYMSDATAMKQKIDETIMELQLTDPGEDQEEVILCESISNDNFNYNTPPIISENNTCEFIP